MYISVEFFYTWVDKLYITNIMQAAVADSKFHAVIKILENIGETVPAGGNFPLEVSWIIDFIYGECKQSKRFSQYKSNVDRKTNVTF